ncbi:MAG: Quinolinate synthase A [Candidatus Woesebacteria bacterium GW2011_GWB1_45_5]|uniref:Quinolinate synthase n=1 Tax=Candidatus Woesebacteria bacterium GW2011_GWB1_45_5 TaxID=1618581 RepID=A0A0G1MPJ8_9BACT|nr:MAG: Quinolinate synthase A [Candidatus Woesebacteria bacterium GW2011_GWB1_45_5]
MSREIFNSLKDKFGSHTPEFELELKAELIHEIRELKKVRNAVVLGHNYMEQILFDTIPDFRGDSLELSRRAAQTDKDVIVFCGVRFMAETAKILNPGKTVLTPSLKAGCSLAASINAQDVKNLREQFPNIPVVTYVNTYADVKAESDVCCTSGNATKVVEWALAEFKTDKVIFLPDEYLAANVAKETGRQIIFPTHEKFTVSDIQNVRQEYPDVLVLAHPECSPEVVDASDFSGSTTAMIAEVTKQKEKPVLLLTECSMGDNIVAANPEANILRLCMVRCPHMNQITLEQTRDALKNMQYQIEIPEDTRLRAELAVKRMIAIG